MEKSYIYIGENIMIINEPIHPLVLNEHYFAVTANDFVKGKLNMKLREFQLFIIAVSQIVKEDKHLKTYITTVPELAVF